MKRVIRALMGLTLGAVVALGTSCAPQAATYDDAQFTPIFNGENFDGWYLKIRSGDAELAKKVYAIEDGVIHVFNDSFPDKYMLGGDCATHGLFYTNKEYSRYILRFDYKWGKKIANNYNQFQYDAGCYYHVVDDAIWPIGVEYQVRYNDQTNTNHTGDYWIGQKTPKMDWYVQTIDGVQSFLPKCEGGVLAKYNIGERRALADAPFHGLDDQWNECEVIVMADEYSIHKLNGEVVNYGVNLGIGKGKIGLQSETGEIFYRNIRLLEFDESIPMEHFLPKDQQ